jgi:hypothetical protein
MKYLDKVYPLLMIFMGIYLTLMAKGVLPRKPKDPEKMALWRRKFGTLAVILGPSLIVLAILRLLFGD